MDPDGRGLLIVLLLFARNNIMLGCPRKLGSMVRINGLFHLLINGVFLGVK